MPCSMPSTTLPRLRRRAPRRRHLTSYPHRTLPCVPLEAILLGHGIHPGQLGSAAQEWQPKAAAAAGTAAALRDAIAPLAAAAATSKGGGRPARARSGQGGRRLLRRELHEGGVSEQIDSTVAVALAAPDKGRVEGVG